MKSANPGYQPGNHWVECQRCGFVYRNSEMAKEWNGLIVCKKHCFETRHPQDFVRGRQEKSTPSGLVNPESPDTFVTVDYSTGEGVVDSDDRSIPSGTFS